MDLYLKLLAILVIPIQKQPFYWLSLHWVLSNGLLDNWPLRQGNFTGMMSDVNVPLQRNSPTPTSPISCTYLPSLCLDHPLVVPANEQVSALGPWYGISMLDTLCSESSPSNTSQGSLHTRETGSQSRCIVSLPMTDREGNIWNERATDRMTEN